MVTFVVDEDAEPATTLLATRPIAQLHPNATLVGGDPARLVVDTDAFDHETYWARDIQPLIGAVALAFTQHRPLVLTPDAVWLTIAQGVAQHVRDHAEELRPRLVRHVGKRLLEVAVNVLAETAAQWTQFVAKLRDLLAEQIGDGRARLFECTFSTSTDTDLVASRIVLFDAYSPYFEYGMTAICGIPEITVTGTPADWRVIRERVDVIAELGLEKWSSRLGPIIDEFVATAEGRPNIALWKRIYNPREVYGGPRCTGWITRLYPTVIDNGARVENPMLAFEMDEPKSLEPVLPPGLVLEEGNPMIEAFIPGVTPMQFPQTLSRASVRLVGSEVSRVALVGGLVAIAQDDRGALTPISGWHLEPATIEVPEVCAAILGQHRAVPGPTPNARTAPNAELAQFYEELASATLFDGDRTWRIRAMPEILSLDAVSFRLFAIADLPGGKHLCVRVGRRSDPAVWFLGTLAPSTRDKRRPFALVEPLNEIVTYGSSLAVLLDTALATGGDISELAGPTLMRAP